MNMKKISGVLALCGALLLCIFTGGCSNSDKPLTYACKHSGLGEAGLECVPHEMSAQLSVYKARRSGNDVVGVVALPSPLFTYRDGGIYGREQGNRLQLWRQAGEMFVEMGCYGGSTSTVTVDKTDWQITNCSFGTYVRGNISGKGDFGIYVRHGADVPRSIELVVGSVHSGRAPRIAM